MMTDDNTEAHEKPQHPMPKYVADSEPAAACWNKLYPDLEALGNFTAAKAIIFERYCLLHAQWQETREDLAQHGDKMPVKNSEGEVTGYKERPEVARQMQLTTKLQQMEKELGIGSGGETDPEEEEPAADQQQYNERYAHLTKYQFKPGQSGNPSGRPKGTISLTKKLKQLFEMPVRVKGKRTNMKYKYADLFVQVALEAALKGDHKFFKEVFERVEGKVPDHVVLESQKKLIAVEAATLAQNMLDLVEEVAGELLADNIADMFITALGNRFEEKFMQEPEEGEEDPEAYLAKRKAEQGE